MLSQSGAVKGVALRVSGHAYPDTTQKPGLDSSNGNVRSERPAGTENESRVTAESRPGNPRVLEGSRQGSLSVVRRRPVFLGEDRSASLLSGALALIRERPMHGSQLPKRGSRIDVADRSRDTRKNLRGGSQDRTCNPSAIFHAA